MTKIIFNKLNGLIFVFAMWFVSRLLVVSAMQIIAPLIDPDLIQTNTGIVSYPNWNLFTYWDGKLYREIATEGYEYANDTEQHNIAFFPVFPLITRGVMSLGIPFEVAGTVVNNLAFLGALLVLYRWVEERQGLNAARWATVVLAWSPSSLFATVTYTEGTFLLLSTAALQAFENREYVKAALFGAITTATRATGVPLIPVFLLVAWRERRSASAYIAAFAAGGGLLLFSIYCAIRFGDPLAFVHAQRGWQSYKGFSLIGWWWSLITQDLLLRKGLGTAFISLTKFVSFFGGIYLLWYSRNQLSRVAITYGFCSIAMIIASGSIISIERFVYGIVSISIALGLLLSRYPRWGYATVGLFALILIYYSMRFSWGIWMV